MFYDNRYSERDHDAYNTARELDMARRDEIESRELIIEPEGESVLERARRRAPIAEQKCCLDPGSFRRVSSLDRDLDTGYLGGDFYMCGTCGSRICEEDYAAIVAYEDSKGQWAPTNDYTAGPLVPEVDARPVAIPTARVHPPRKVA